MTSHVPRIRNDFAELERVKLATATVLERERLPPNFLPTVNLVLEEVLTNILKYGYDDEDEHQIEITLRLIDSEFTAVVTDDGREFNPLERPEPDTTLHVHQREPGGLGIHFVRKLFTSVEYRREHGRNVLILRKCLSEQPRS